MIEINLLPWREEQLRAKNNLFGLVIVIVAICCTGLCFLVNSYVKEQTKYEMSEAEFLSKEINMLEGKIIQIKGLQERQDLLATKKESIQALQVSRSFIVQIFEDIVKAVPDGLLLVSMSRKDNKLILQGISSSNAKISVFMRNLEKLTWLKNSILQEIKTEELISDVNKSNSKNKQIVFKLQGDINH